MLRVFVPLLFLFSLGLVLCSTVTGQEQTSLGEAARQAKAAKSAAPDKPAKVITNETLARQGACTAPAQPAKEIAPEDAVRTAFLRRIAGRWNLAYFRKGNQSWWPDHGSAQPKNKIHYLFGPTELLIESRPEFNLPSITGRLVYASVRQVSEELFNVVLYQPCEPATQQTRRFNPDFQFESPPTNL